MYYAIEEGLLCIVAPLIIAAVAFTVCAAILLVQEAVRHGIRALQRAGEGVLRFFLGRMPHSREGRGKALPAVARSPLLSAHAVKVHAHWVKL